MSNPTHDAIVRRCVERYNGLSEVVSEDTILSVCEAHDFDEQKAVVTLDEIAAFSVKDSTTPSQPAWQPRPAAGRQPSPAAAPAASLEAQMLPLVLQGMRRERDPRDQPPAP
eukprot:Hpha_TRINITY_DN37067_c0_g1::TRINITY_DN37067_c0_g1_i1::g.83133::m.83133